MNKDLLVDMYFNQGKTQAQIGKELGIKTGVVEYHFKKHGLIGRKTKYSFNKNIVVDSNLGMWYLLGLMSADGWITKTNKSYNVHINLSSKGGEALVEDIKKFLEYTGPVYYYVNKGARLTITSTFLAEWFANKGMAFKNKTFDLDIPREVFKTEAQVRSFIRGFFDGDGCFEIKISEKTGLITPKRVRILTASKAATDLIFNLVNEYLSIESHNKVVRSKYFEFSIYRQEDIFKFLTWIYFDKDQPLRLRGKFNLYRIAKIMI